MFIVETNVVGKEIEGTVVGECFWRWGVGFGCDCSCDGGAVEEVVFCDEVSCARVEGAG